MTQSDETKKNEEGTSESGSGFKLLSQSTAFSNKTDSIFGNLDFLEKKHEAYEKVRSHKQDRDYMKEDPSVDRGIDTRDTRGRLGRGHLRGRGQPRGRGRRGAPYVPMYRQDPRKWTMYDLSDLDPATMSERSTKAAAMSFLSDLKKRKASELEDDPSDSDSGSKVMFKKPKNVDAKDNSKTAKASGSKLVMPEFNFGAQKKKEKAKKSGPIAAGSGISLSHLDDEEDDDG